MDAALSQWRVLSAFLLHPHRAERMSLAPSGASVLSQAAGLANAMNAFLGPFIAPGALAEQTKHLRLVIIDTAKLGYVLFGQPSEWRFVYSGPSKAGTRTLDVCAGLNKISNKDGLPYGVPQQIVAPVLFYL